MVKAMRRVDCKQGLRVRVVGQATQRDFPRCVGAVGLIDEVRPKEDDGGPNCVCVMFRRAVCHLTDGLKAGQKHLWLPPRDLEAVK